MLLRALALLLVLSGCGDTEVTTRPVLVRDGGYALVEVRVFGDDAGEIEITIEGAEDGEGYAVFRNYGDAPFHSGWFDVGPWLAACEAAPISSACTDVNRQRAGTFLGLSRQNGAAAPRVAERQQCDEHPEFGVCVYYYAIVSARRGPERRAWIRVTTSDDDDAEPARIKKVW